MIDEADLNFETHLAPYREGYLGKSAESDTYWHHQAQMMHMINVVQATTDFRLSIPELANCFDNSRFYYFVMFGLGRRYGQLNSFLRQLVSQVPPNRTEPMTTDEVNEIAPLLNLAYINIRGTLDNFALALLQFTDYEFADKLYPQDVHLFSRKLWKHPALSDLENCVSPFQEWVKDFKNRRDPVAHRIPLSLVPSFLSPEDVKKRQILEAQWDAASAKMIRLTHEDAPREEQEAAEAQADRLQDAFQRIGKFMPAFGHNPEDDFERLYPTLPQDVGMLVRISRDLTDMIRRMAS